LGREISGTGNDPPQPQAPVNIFRRVVRKRGNWGILTDNLKKEKEQRALIRIHTKNGGELI